MNQLAVDSLQEGIISPLLKDGKERGELRFDVQYFPVLEPPEGSAEVPESSESAHTSSKTPMTHFFSLPRCWYRSSCSPPSQGP